MTSAVDAHFFRHEYGRLVALLTRRVGVQYLELVEDAVQEALLAAVESWSTQEIPENPSAWLYRPLTTISWASSAKGHRIVRCSTSKRLP
jgi:predicted RNA polymerase sigma factor